MKNQFEQHLKQSLEGFEAEYNPADWSDLESRLNKAKAGKATSLGKGLMIAASVIATSGIIYYFSTTETANNVSSDHSVAQEQSVVTKDVNPVHSIEVNDQRKPSSNQSPAIANNTNAKSEKNQTSSNIQEDKLIAPEKTETQTVANNAETKTLAQEQVQNPAEQLPASTPAALSATFRTGTTNVCQGSPVQFIADKNDAACTYKWTFGDGETSVEQSPKHVFAEAGTYTVKLRVISAKDKRHAEQKNTITVIAAPSVQMDHIVSEDNYLLVSFDADADKAVDWKWDFGDKQTSALQNPIHTFRKEGNYPVVVTARNSAGCSAVVKKELNLKLDLLAPDVITPNGDGTNDTWMPARLQTGDYIFTLTITDKAGNEVFKTSDKNQSWTGSKTKTGDTFIWKAVVKDKNGNESNQIGPITVYE